MTLAGSWRATASGEIYRQSPPSGGPCRSPAKLIEGCREALGNLPRSACLAGDVNGDGQVSINEILAAVRNALAGCG